MIEFGNFRFIALLVAVAAIAVALGKEAMLSAIETEKSTARPVAAARLTAEQHRLGDELRSGFIDGATDNGDVLTGPSQGGVTQGNAADRSAEVIDLGPRITPESPPQATNDQIVIDLGERIRPEDWALQDTDYSEPVDLGPRISADDRTSYTTTDDEPINIGPPMEVPIDTSVEYSDDPVIELGQYIPVDAATGRIGTPVEDVPTAPAR